MQDWQRVRQSRGKSQSVSNAATASPPPPTASSAADRATKTRDREDKSRQRAAKELGKLAKKEQKLEEERRRLVTARIKLEAQLESSSEGGWRGDGDWGEDDRLLAALDLLENVGDRASTVGDRPRRSKSARLRRQSCMVATDAADAFQRATSARAKTSSAAGPRSPATDDSAVVKHDSDSRLDDPAKLHPT